VRRRLATFKRTKGRRGIISHCLELIRISKKSTNPVLGRKKSPGTLINANEKTVLAFSLRSKKKSPRLSWMGKGLSALTEKRGIPHLLPRCPPGKKSHVSSAKRKGKNLESHKKKRVALLRTIDTEKSLYLPGGRRKRRLAFLRGRIVFNTLKGGG